MEEREMDEQIILTEGLSVEMKNISKHEDFKDLTFWINKHNWYASRAAKDYLYNLEQSGGMIINLWIRQLRFEDF